MKLKPFVTLDIESLGVPEICGTNFIVMPSFSFCKFNGFNELPELMVGVLSSQEQINAGATFCASTIAFWMGQAKQSISALQIIKSLTDNSSHLYHFTSNRVEELVFNSAAELLEEVNHKFEIIDPSSKLFHYGNGCIFDQNIYESASINLTGKSQQPAKFWNIGNVRTLRNLWVQAGNNYKELEAGGISWAKAKMEKMDTIRYGIYPVKHDPAFDALVEAYCVARIVEMIKI